MRDTIILLAHLFLLYSDMEPDTDTVRNRHELDINSEITNAFWIGIRASSNKPVSMQDTIILLAHFSYCTHMEHERTTDLSTETVSNHQELDINNEIINAF